MPTATYILGSNEYVVVELERTALSADFTPANWTYEMILVALADEFDAGDETLVWADAVYELAASTHHTVKALLTELTELAGQYIAYVRMSSATETETPTILRSRGKVVVTGPALPAAP